MKPLYRNGNVTTVCSDCGTVTTFENREPSGSAFGAVIIYKQHKYQDENYTRIFYMTMRCTVCHRGALAKLHDKGDAIDTGVLESFLPSAVDRATVPNDVPEDVLKEYREAELCASIGAYRAASALLRSTLEKVLKANGYIRDKDKLKNLVQKIDAAASDGVLTDARRKRAHENIRVLGNDVLHEDWRDVTAEEYEESHKYIQRILEDLYDDRQTVEAILAAKGRLQAQVAQQQTTS